MLNEKIASAKEFARKHRAKIAVAVTLTGCVIAQIKIAGNWNDFLEEHDLTDEYYSVEED